MFRPQTKLYTHNRVSKRTRLFKYNPPDKSLAYDEGDLDRCKRNVPFCCAKCKCDEKVIGLIFKYHKGTKSDEHVFDWIEPDTTGDYLSHRRCCHHLIRHKDESMEQFKHREFTWAPNYLSQLEHAVCLPVPEKKLWMDVDELDQLAEKHQFFINTENYHARLIPKVSEEFQRLQKNETYQHKVVQRFERHVQVFEHQQAQAHSLDDDDDNDGLVVLDCFGGVGTSIVALKKLGIKISKIIYIDNDKVAKHVYRTNHDVKYHNLDVGWKGSRDGNEENQNVSDNQPKPRQKRKKDGVSHDFNYKSWEDLVGGKNVADSDKLIYAARDFLQIHGNIDLVLASPPQIDHEIQLRYMLEVATFIRALRNFQKKSKKSKPMYFLVEDEMKEGEGLNNKIGEIYESFKMRWDPVFLNAKRLSPCHRSKLFWTNIPLENLDDTDLTPVDPDSCLEQEENQPPVELGGKWRTFVMHQDFTGNATYLGRFVKTREQELLMGYPQGYVEEPVQELFCVLRDDALCHQFEKHNVITNSKVPVFQGHWRKQLHPKYHCFAGNYHSLGCIEPHRFEVIHSAAPFVGLLLAPRPSTPKTEPIFCNADDYAKYLLAVATPVPVIEHMLKPLKKIYKSRNYPQYTYQYAWKSERAGVSNNEWDSVRTSPSHTWDSVSTSHIEAVPVDDLSV